MDTPAQEIKKILDDNQVGDLKRFLSKREQLNFVNSVLIYVFHFIMACVIFISSFGAGTNDQRLIWIGVGLSLLASLIQIYEKLNDNQLKKLLNDIMTIKAGKYVDESAIINPDTDLNRQQTTQLMHIGQTGLPNLPNLSSLPNGATSSLIPADYILDHQLTGNDYKS